MKRFFAVFCGVFAAVTVFAAPQQKSDQFTQDNDRPASSVLPSGTQRKAVEPWKGPAGPASQLDKSPSAQRPAQKGDAPAALNPQGGDGHQMRSAECDGAIYTNKDFDSYTGLASYYATDDGSYAFVADSAVFSESVVAEGYAWWSIDTPGATYTGNALYYIWLGDGSGGSPGTAVAANYVAATQTYVGDWFGYNLNVYQISGESVNLSAGNYYVTLAPAMKENGGVAYWGTAPDSGQAAWWYGSAYGYNYWQQDWNSGSTENYAFCVLGRRADPCSDSIYSNGAYDETNANANFRNADNSVDAWNVDDYTTGYNVIIQDLHWYQCESGFDFAGTADWLVLDGSSGAPGGAITGGNDYAVTRFDTGLTVFGFYSLLRYDLEGLDVHLSPGTYFLGMRPVQNSFSSYSYHMFAPVTGYDTYFKSAYFGANDWVSITYWLGSATNLSFCITGEIQPFDCNLYDNVVWNNNNYDYVDGYGSWRLTSDGGTWSILSADDVTFDQRYEITDVHFFSIDYSVDFNGTIDFYLYANDGSGGGPGTQLGAVTDWSASRNANGDTFLGYPIYFYSASGFSVTAPAGTSYAAFRPVASSSPGIYLLTASPVIGSSAWLISPYYGVNSWTKWSDYLGGETEDVAFCLTGRAAPGNQPCDGVDNAILGNGAYNTDYIFLSERTISDGTFDALTADDVTFSDRAEITDVHFFGADASTFDFVGVDVYLFASDGSGSSPGTLLDSATGVAASRVATGDSWNGYPYYLYTVTGLSMYAPGGKSWIGIRPVANAATGYAYLATAAVSGDGAYFNYPYYYGGAWVSWADFAGITDNVSFCLSGNLNPPPHDYCDDLSNVLWSSGLYDEYTALYDYRVKGGSAPRDIWAVDSVGFDARTTITDAHWYMIDDSWYGGTFDWNGTADVIVTRYDGSTNSPAGTVTEQSDLAATLVNTGDVVFSGYPVKLYNVTGLSINLRATQYFFGARPVAEKTDYNAYWLTSPDGGADAFYRSKYFFGDTNWHDTGYAGAAFCLTGDVRCHCGDSAQDNSACDFNDIDCFVAALISPTDWAKCTLGDKTKVAYICTNDINGDGSVDFLDIDGFVQALIDGGCK